MIFASNIFASIGWLVTHSVLNDSDYAIARNLFWIDIILTAVMTLAGILISGRFQSDMAAPQWQIANGSSQINT